MSTTLTTTATLGTAAAPSKAALKKERKLQKKEEKRRSKQEKQLRKSGLTPETPAGLTTMETMGTPAATAEPAASTSGMESEPTTGATTLREQAALDGYQRYHPYNGLVMPLEFYDRLWSQAGNVVETPVTSSWSTSYGYESLPTRAMVIDRRRLESDDERHLFDLHGPIAPMSPNEVAIHIESTPPSLLEKLHLGGNRTSVAVSQDTTTLGTGAGAASTTTRTSMTQRIKGAVMEVRGTITGHKDELRNRMKGGDESAAAPYPTTTAGTSAYQ